MSTSVNLSYDLNNYLKSSGSSINNPAPTNKSIKDWFTGNGSDDKKWYQPLRTSPSDDDLSTNNTSNGTSRWFQNPFKSSQPEPKGWFPSLVLLQFIDREY